jgi:acid phosphatase family membrane protein YuiD
MDVFLWDWVLLISGGIPSNHSRLLTFLKSLALSQLEGIDGMQVTVRRNWHFMLLLFNTTNFIGYLIHFKG